MKIPLFRLFFYNYIWQSHLLPGGLGRLNFGRLMLLDEDDADDDSALGNDDSESSKSSVISDPSAPSRVCLNSNPRFLQEDTIALRFVA
jgi:hypothetical protein